MADGGALIGRGVERSRLRSSLDRGRSIIVAGGAGVGKSRLARELLGDVATEGARTAWTAATRSSQSLPLAALAPLIAPSGTFTGGLVGPLEVLTELHRQHAASGCQRTVFAIDDAHLLDDASATVVHHLAGLEWSAVLVTFRLGEVCPDAITALWHDDLVEDVELQPLSREETDRLVVDLLGAPCGALVLRILWESSQGNPLYCRELVSSARRSRSVALLDGMWQMVAELPVNLRLRELVEARVTGVDDAVQAVLDCVALSEPTPFWLVQHCTGPTELAAAEDLGLIEVSDVAGRAMVQLSHPLYGDVVRSRMAVARRRSVCGALADAMELSSLRRPDDALRLVTWRLDAGQQAPVEMLLTATRRASAGLDQSGAERFAVAARRAAPSDHRATLALVDALYRQHRHAEALAVIIGAPVPAEDVARTEHALLHAKLLWFGLDRVDEAIEVLDAAAGAVDDETCRVWLRLYRARLDVTTGYPGAATAMTEALSPLNSLDPRVKPLALGTFAAAFAFCGQKERALQLRHEAGDTPSVNPAEHQHVIAEWTEPTAWTAAWLVGDLPAAERFGQVMLERGLATRHAFSVSVANLALGWVAVMKGDLNSANRCFADVGGIEHGDDWHGVRSLFLAGKAWVAIFAGDASGADNFLKGAQSVVKDGTRWFAPLIDLGRAWLDAVEGDPVSAIGRLGSVAVEMRQRGLLPYEVHALHGIARLGQPDEVRRRLQQLEGDMDGPLVGLAAAHATALAIHDADALEAVAREFEAHLFPLLAAEAAGSAAAQHTRDGGLSKAEAAWALSERMVLQCPGARSPALALRTTSVLTARERQVAGLAAQGLATRVIAARLFVSVRTVDTHLAHIYAKLGLSRRNELPAALAAMGPPKSS